MKIKVCGMRDVENIQDLILLKPDFIGFIFHEKSLRNVMEIPKINIPKNMKKVGVFVDKPTEFIQQKATQFKLDFIQLHGSETPEFCKELQQKGFKIIKAFNVDGHFNFKSTIVYEPYCAYFLFDAKGKKAGGNGITFNWKILHNYSGETPFLLSGGIDSSMNKEILYIKHPKCIGIDINSKFEIKPAYKDIKRIEKFITELKKQK